MDVSLSKARIVALLIGAAALFAVGFALNYALGANVQVGGALLGGTFMSLAAGLVVWERTLMQHDETTEAMQSPRSDDADRAEAEQTFGAGARAISGRRPWLVTMLTGALGTIAIAMLFPLRSFTKNLGSELAHTSWTKGARLVREDGTVVKVADLEIDSIVTVFPEGRVGPSDLNDMANSATVLIRVPPGDLALPPDRSGWAPQGFVAYSKVCTHAGCPVALYRAAARELFCPCHQSTFDVLRGGRRIFGPAVRALPQLPLEIAADGTIRATGDFPEPIGPGYWDRA